jgi:hypothetical protein
MERLRREVLVPVPSYRRASSLVGLSIAMVLLASAVDAVVWTYQARREAREEVRQERMRPAPARWQVAEPREVDPPSVIKPVDSGSIGPRTADCDVRDPLCGP